MAKEMNAYSATARNRSPSTSLADNVEVAAETRPT